MECRRRSGAWCCGLGDTALRAPVDDAPRSNAPTQSGRGGHEQEKPEG